MRRDMSRNLGLYKYLWPGSVYRPDADYAVLSAVYNALRGMGISIWTTTHS